MNRYEKMISLEPAEEQFIWEDGLPSASSIHGIFLNTHSVFVEPNHGAKLNNILIQDLSGYHSFHENVRLSMGDVLTSTGITPWNSMWDGRGVLGSNENLYKYYNILLSNYENSLNSDDNDVEDDDSWKDLNMLVVHQQMHMVQYMN